MKTEPLGQRKDDPSADVAAAADALGLTFSVGTLKKHPGCLHWHLRPPKQTGTIELTWRPDTHEFWLSIHANREKPWMADVIPELKARLSSRTQ